jgi:hypothetical protein
MRAAGVWFVVGIVVAKFVKPVARKNCASRVVKNSKRRKNMPRKHRRRRRTTRRIGPSLRFNPHAWAKLVYLRDRGETEIGGFGLSAPDDPLLVVDFLTVRQRCTWASVKFDDGAVADLFDDLVDQGLSPAQFGRIWLHTHPGDCPLPSITDEATFARVFGRTDWSVMGIVGKNDATFARLSFHVGPGGAWEIPVAIDFGQPFDASDPQAWDATYAAHITPEVRVMPSAAAQLPDGEIIPWTPETEEDFYDGPAEFRPF